MKIQRLIAILTVLLQNERISATSLAEMFEVSVRTIYRDIGTLEMAGIPMVTYTGVNGGIGIIGQYKIDKKLFTNQDISTLLTSLYSVSGSISDGKLNQTLEKIKSLIPSEHVKSIELTSRQLYIDMAPWAANPQLSNNLELVQKALEENKVVTFTYASREQSPKERIVEPHQLVLKENNWYLRSFCREKQNFRIFKIRRMNNLAILSEKFESKEFSPAITDFKDWQSSKITMVELLIDESLQERAQDFCREEYMEKTQTGQIKICMPFVESDIGYGLLLGLGHKCICLGPETIQKELMRRIDLMRALYS